MVGRFTDSFARNIESSDFLVRKRRPMSLELLVIFAIAFVAIYFTASIMNDLGSKFIFFITLSTIIGLLAWFTIMFASRHRDMVLATEFQNAMLASAARLSTRFCMIASRDGSIVYIDSGFQTLFPHFMRGDSRTIDGLFANAKIPEETYKQIITVLEENKNGRVLLPLTDDNGNVTPLMVTIDILPRPKGYFLFRGRDYVEKRAVSTAENADTNSALLLSQALYTLPEGVLIANNAGTITYVNHALEEWLGYQAGELLAAPVTLPQVICQYGGRDAPQPVFESVDSNVTLRCKDGSLIAMDIRQKALREGTQILGISAILAPSRQAT